MSFTEYQKAEEDLLEQYGRPAFRLSRDTLEVIRQEVQDEIFAESRKLVEKQLAVLRSETSKESDWYEACRILSYELFRPWYQQERYYSADYFAKNGGVELLVNLIQSGRNTQIVLVSMSACWNFCSDDKRSRLLIQKGILPAIEPLLKKGDLWTRAKCIGLLWGLVEFPDIQEEVVHAGFITPLIEVLSAKNGNVKIIELSIGCLQCCCSNFRLTEQLIESRVADKIIKCCKAISENAGFGLVDGNEGRRDLVMICYMGYNAVASLFLLAEVRVWMDRLNQSKGLAMGSTSVAYFVEKKKEMMDIIQTWLDENSYKEVRGIEDGHYVWRYMKPFTSLLYAPNPVVRCMGAFSLANLLQGPENRRLFVNEEGRGCHPLQCSTWCKDEETRQLAKDAMNQVYQDGVDPPSLQAICRFYICDNFDLYNHTLVKSLPHGVQATIIPFTHK